MRIDHDTLVRSVLYRYVSGKKTVLLYQHSYFFSDLTELPQPFWPLNEQQAMGYNSSIEHSGYSGRVVCIERC